MNVHTSAFPAGEIRGQLTEFVSTRVHRFANIPLAGSSEVPANASEGSGTLTAVYDDVTNVLCYFFDRTLGADATKLTAAHFHGPALPGTNAGVAIGVIGEAMGTEGTSGGEVLLTEAQEADLLEGLWYLNLHSDAFPGGELRGQLIESSSHHAFADLPVTSEQSAELVDLARQHDRILAVTYNYSGYPMVRQAREMVARGDLGAIRVVQAEYAQDWLSEPLEETGQKQAAWRTDPAQSGAGGCVGDIGTHAFHLAVALASCCQPQTQSAAAHDPLDA